MIENLPYAYNNDIPKDTAYGSTAWVTSAIDHLRFISAIDGFPSRPDILSASTISNMTAVASPGSRNGDYYYGMGWEITPSTDEWFHGGSSDASARIRRLIVHREADFVVEGSADLVQWSPVGIPVGDTSPNEDGTVSVTVRDSAPLDAGASTRFLRLKIVRKT